MWVRRKANFAVPNLPPPTSHLPPPTPSPLPQRPQHLPQHPHPHRHILRRRPRPHQQPPQHLLRAVRRIPPRIPRPLQHLHQQPRSRSVSSPVAASPSPSPSRCASRFNGPSSRSRTSSYRHTAAACPRFIEACRTPACSAIGIVTNAWQWLSSTLLSPVFSEPNSSATRCPAASRRCSLTRSPAPRAVSSGCSSARAPTAVVPSTSVESRHRLRHRPKHLRRPHHLRRIHRRPRHLHRLPVFTHRPQPPKPEVMHRPRHRPNVAGVPRPHQHHHHPPCSSAVSIRPRPTFLPQS